MENEQTLQKKTNGLPKKSSNYMSLKHMKSLIVLVVGILAVGCETPLPQRPIVTLPQESLPPLPVTELTPEQKQKILRDSVVGEYEFKADGVTGKQVYLDNGVYEQYLNGKKVLDSKWSIVDGEIHVEWGSGGQRVCRINPDKSITFIAQIRNGKRTDLTKENQWTAKKIK